MDGVFVSIILVPGIVAIVLFALFSYLYYQTREPYFRAWQLGWAAYVLYFGLATWNLLGQTTALSMWATKLCLLLTALAIFVSTRLVKDPLKFHWYDAALAAIGAVWAYLVVRSGASHAPLLSLGMLQVPYMEVEVGIAALLLYCAYRFFRFGRQRDSMGYRLLGISLGFWAVLLTSRQFHDLFAVLFSSAGHFLSPIPQMLLGISMVMVLYENERRSVQENLLAFSSLDVESGRLIPANELAPSLQKILDRLVTALKAERAALCIHSHWHEVLPSVQQGFSPEFLARFDGEFTDAVSTHVFRRGGWIVFRDLRQELGLLPVTGDERLLRLRAIFAQEGVASMTCVSLQTRDRSFGVVLLPHTVVKKTFGSSHIRLLLGLAMQIGMTLENYVLMHNTQRRTREYELLTQVGQVVSSRLDSDEVLRTVHKELGLLFDTASFYVAFLEGEEIRFEYEFESGQLMPKRTRRVANGITEHIIRSGQPILCRSNMDELRRQLGVVPMGRPAKSFLGVPIYRYNQAIGVMAAMNYERENVYDQRDLEVMETAAGQVAVAMENARLFAEEQRRARFLAFLNNVSKTAISSQDAEQMLAEIVSEIQKNFNFDHIGIGLLDYATKDIEIKAEAGTTAKALGKRVPLGVGILGRVARTNETALVQNTADASRLAGIIPDARSVLCVPLTYAETLLGVLNIESKRENAFAQQDVLILRTLADLLATALHNAFIFQKMQQQSITDGLTGIKTRRFFLESVQAEGKRASRSGRPYSVVMMDLDKFKEVNDSVGHLEGDLVLARVGRLLEQKCRQSNVVARYGGDEFVILMPETGVEQAQILSERLRLWLATDPMLNERKITGSFGVASFPVHGSTVEDIIRVADAGMYVSKKGGGNRVSTAEEFAEGETSLQQRQVIASYVEGFLQRERTGPESADELVTTLRKLGSSVKDGSAAEVLMDAVRTLNRAAEARETVAGHGEAVARYAELIARELAMSEDEAADLTFAARVHDVGKIIVPEQILNKPSSLTEDEYHLVKTHTIVGAQIIATIPGSQRMCQFVRHHHERFDGGGYPDALKGEQIPLGARIIAVAEAYVDMMTDRPYASARPQNEAIDELESLAGSQFDGMVVRILVRQLRGDRVSRTGAS
ncbi:MAG TPA: diguanylate cyclase [Terriglobales bacterium]|nr:diguanylate cyclase [Terriglobales bacterium]